MNGLHRLYFLKIEIKELKDEISNLSELSANEMNGMPNGNAISNPTHQYFMKKQKLIEKLNRKLEKYIDELTRIENIIDEIGDAETRLIARYRFIDNLTWEEIGKKMHRDRSVCYKKVKKYFE